MKRIAAIAITLVMFMSTVANADEGWIKDTGWFSWDDTNTKLQVPLTLLLLADYGQTLYISDHCQYQLNDNGSYTWEVSESNGALGRCPSRVKVRQHFAWSTIALATITFITPPKASYVIQGSAITIEFSYVGHNAMLNIGVRF